MVKSKIEKPTFNPSSEERKELYEAMEDWFLAHQGSKFISPAEFQGITPAYESYDRKSFRDVFYANAKKIQKGKCVTIEWRMVVVEETS